MGKGIHLDNQYNTDIYQRMLQSLWYMLKCSSSLDFRMTLNIGDDQSHNRLRMSLQYLNLGNLDSIPSSGFHGPKFEPAHLVREFLAFEGLKPWAPIINELKNPLLIFILKKLPDFLNFIPTYNSNSIW